MSNLKKPVGLLLAITLLASLSISAFATTPAQDETVYPESYIKYEYIDGEIHASEILSTSATTAEEAGAVVEFNRDEVESELVAHLISNNPSMSNEEALSVASRLADNIENAESVAQDNVQESISSRAMSTTSGNQVIVPIGKVEDNAFVEADPNATIDFPGDTGIVSFSYVPDSHTSIISEGWSVNPYRKASTLWVQYTTAWYGLDQYKTPVGGTYYQRQDVTVSKSLGFNANGELRASDALKFGLTVTGSYTKSQSLYQGFTLNVPGWTKINVRL